MPEQREFVFESDVKNDKIDIYGEPDVHLKKLPSSIESEFNIQIEGKSIDYSVVNAIRRTILLNIPIYGFHRSNIFIEVEKSKHMYNNDLIYNQIETLPIYDIPNYYDLENPELYLSNEVLKSLFGKFIQEKYSADDKSINSESNESVDANKKLFKIELGMNVKNISDTDKFVTTHDVVLKINNKVSNSYMTRDPISIIVLKPGEEISLRAEANLGISKILATYEATTNAIHKEISSSKYELSYETLGQLDKNLIFTKACIILIKKLEHLNKFIQSKYKEEPENIKYMEIQLFGEEHTLGNLIATALQKCDLVAEAGYAMPHPFIDQIVIRYRLETDTKAGPIKVFVDTVKYLIRLFEQISHVAFKKS
jgi:DNA-directed RNA polymerase subunit L